MNFRQICFMVTSTSLMVFTSVACDDSKPKASNQNPGSQNAVATGTGTGATTGDATQGGAGNSQGSTGGRSFYLGFDGKNDYSLLLSQGREYKVADPSIATIKRETVSLAPKTIDQMVEDAKKKEPELFKNPNAENFLRQFLGCSRPAIKITPLKPGKTTITGSRTQNNRGDRWGQENNTQLSLVITQYSADQFDAGNKRYHTEGSGNLKACKSCHETGEENAPPHELGKISEISDAQAAEWITTGKTSGRTARITHAWEFSSDAEKKGVVAYLRGKASKDLENFTKLVVEEEISSFRERIKENGGRLPTPPSTNTGTATQGGSEFRCRGFGRPQS